MSRSSVTAEQSLSSRPSSSSGGGSGGRPERSMCGGAARCVPANIRVASVQRRAEPEPKLINQSSRSVRTHRADRYSVLAADWRHGPALTETRVIIHLIQPPAEEGNLHGSSSESPDFFQVRVPQLRTPQTFIFSQTEPGQRRSGTACTPPCMCVLRRSLRLLPGPRSSHPGFV